MKNNINIEKESNYKSILQKINDKPLIVEYIFSFVKDKPYKFLNLIEKDQILKEAINSRFSQVTKNNNFSKEINENIQVILLYKKYREILHQYRNIDIKIFNKYNYEKKIIYNLDPSFLVYKSNYIFNNISGNNSLFKPSMESLIEIAFHEKEKYEHIQLCLLPSKKNKFKDGLYIRTNLNKKNKKNKTNDNICSNKEIDVLYCIIDDNEYYLDEIPCINENIKINEVYFIYIKGLKNINIYNAMEKYLHFFNKKTINRITFGFSFGFYNFEKENNLNKNAYKYFDQIPIMKMINNILITNQKLSFHNIISIDLSEVKNIENKLKFYLGIYCLFENKKFMNDELIEINSKSYHPHIMEKIENSKGNILIIKYNGLSSLDDKNFNKIVKKCLNLNFSNIIFYIAKNANNTNNNNNKNIQNDEEIKFNFDESNNYFFYSEIPTKKLHFDNNLLHFEVADSNDNLILQENNTQLRYYREYTNFLLINHLFLLKKYDNLCFKWKFDENNYYKMYFIKKKFICDLVIVVKNNNHSNDIDRKDLKIYADKRIAINFEEVINYCKENLDLKFNKIQYLDTPLEWNDILKNKTKNKKDKAFAKKFLPNKMNEKQFLEYELEDDEYFDDDEEENDFQEDF